MLFQSPDTKSVAVVSELAGSRGCCSSERDLRRMGVHRHPNNPSPGGGDMEPRVSHGPYKRSAASGNPRVEGTVVVVDRWARLAGLDRSDWGRVLGRLSQEGEE